LQKIKKNVKFLQKVAKKIMNEQQFLKEKTRK